MEQQTLKITGVLSDPTRFSIYQYISRQHRDITVQEIADTFKIHTNVARLHLSKLEDVAMLVSETKKLVKAGALVGFIDYRMKWSAFSFLIEISND